MNLFASATAVFANHNRDVKIMAHENWQLVKEIFADALRQKPELRPEFLDSVCSGDKTLRREVESLLASFDSAESFMEKPAVGEIADSFVEVNSLKTGFTFGHYEIIKQIGVGGMGEVYLANDKKLDRKVAIKILNKKFSQHESNLNRFVREAKAASSLNHPNILVIHEIGETADQHYIVSEYVEGKTLREIFKEKNLELEECLDVSIQVANALSAAHAARLIHRDIKPENIMIRPDGLVKILDFGLAKLISPEVVNLEYSTIKINDTAKGIIMGTVNYMSPEQAKGEKVDERTDIFSFGAMIYEIIAGRTPFQGDSMSETFANLINQNPLPLSNFAANLPDKLPKIVSKTLCKNKNERYQTMKALISDLKELKENITVEENFERSTSMNEDNATIILQATTGEANKQTAETQNSLSHRIKQKSFAVIVLTVLMVGITGFGYWFLVTKNTVADANKSMESIAVDVPKPASKLYWQMTEVEQLVFIRERARYVETLIGDEPTEFDEEMLQTIKVEIDGYLEIKDSLAQKPFEEGLRVIYGRASQYAPIVIRAYEAREVAPALGIYQAMVESEYHDCYVSKIGTVGLFLFKPSTAQIYGLTPKNYCNVEKQSDAAARYMADLTSDFGEGKSSKTLVLFSFNQGEVQVRDYLRQLHGRGITERSFWAVFRYRQKLQTPLADEAKWYVPRFFAAAIIGETPESFELSTPALTTLR